MDKDGALTNLLPADGELYYYPNAFAEADAESFFEELRERVQWRQQPVKIFGRDIMQPRLTAWVGDSNKPYTYSGLTLVPSAWTDTLLIIRRRVEEICGARFTSVLLNLYRDGNDYMGWHRDNEKALGSNPVIASVSLGAVRTFELRPYRAKTPKISIEAASGSVIEMRGSTQQHWEHRLPKQQNSSGSRINLTFRKLV